MAKQHSDAKNQAGKERQQTRRPDSSRESTATGAAPAGLTGAELSNDSTAAIAARLGDERLPTAQRQELAGQVARLQGNRLMQRVIAQLEQAEEPHLPTDVVQRQPQGAAAQRERVPSIFDTMRNYFQSLPRPVQEILRRYSVFEVDRDAQGRWTLRRTNQQPFMDISGGPELLFKLHQQRAHQDYLILIEQMIIPGIRQGLAQPVRTSVFGNRGIIQPLMWLRNPPPGLSQNQGLAARLAAARQQAYPLLGRAAARQRQARVTNEGVAGRPNYAFIMGQDRARSRNRFYTNATMYVRTLPNITVIRNLRTLEDVLDHVRGLPRDRPIGSIYIVSHAHRSGRLSFRLTGQAQERGIGGAQLGRALAGGQINPLNTPAVDARTRVIIKGCDAGQDVGILNQLRLAFGGRPTVLAPKHKQVYIRRGRNVTEGMARGYWIEYPARPGLTMRRREAALRAKYPDVPARNWRRWMRERQWTSTISNTYEYTISYDDRAAVPRSRRARLAAIREQVPDFDDYSWRVRVRAVGGEFRLIGTGTKITYTVERPFRDERGRLRQFDLSDESAYGIDERPLPGQQATAVPWRRQRRQ